MGERANGDDLSGAKVQDGREKTFILWSPDLARPWGWLGHGRRKGASFPFIAFSSFCVLVVGWREDAKWVFVLRPLKSKRKYIKKEAKKNCQCSFCEFFSQGSIISANSSCCRHKAIKDTKFRNRTANLIQTIYFCIVLVYEAHTISSSYISSFTLYETS